MTERQIQRQLEVLEEATRRALQSKETALKFLEDAGIIKPSTPPTVKDKKKK